MNLNRYKVPDECKDGVWIAAKDDPTVRFLIKLPHELNKPYRRGMMDSVKLNSQGSITDTLGQIEEAQEELFLTHCLMGWEGVELNNQPTAFTKKTARVFFDEYPVLFEEIRQEATRQAEALNKETEELVKNS